jgi:hypothetical protein
VALPSEAMRVAIAVKSLTSRPKSILASTLPPAATNGFSKPSALSLPALVFS